VSADGGAGGDRREMEANHRVLVGGVAETLRGAAASDAWHLTESPHATTPRVGERRHRAATTNRRDSGPGRVFADRLWTIIIAARTPRSSHRAKKQVNRLAAHQGKRLVSARSGLVHSAFALLGLS
jgi:hypothetical protein